jgi:hypothetical protein
MVLILEPPDASARRACPAQVVAGASAVQAAAHWDARVKCRAKARDSLLAWDHDFQTDSAARLVAVVYLDARERFLEQQLQAVLPKAVYSVLLLKAVYSWGPQPMAEPLRLRVVMQEVQDEWASALRVQWASRQPEHPLARVLAAWEQFSEPMAQQPEALQGGLLELPA